MSHPIVSTPRQVDFLTIPETPLVYWLRPRFFELLQSSRRLSSIAEVKQGLATADNERFTRCFWEVNRIGVVQDGKPVSGRWFWYAKGGGYQKWAGLEWLVVDWENNGERIRNFPNAFIRNEALYFRPAVTSTLMAQGSMGARLFDGGVFGADCPTMFIKDRTSWSRPALTAFLSTRAVSYLLRMMTQSLKFREGYVAQTPLADSAPAEFDQIGRSCIAFKRQLVASVPVERSFALLPAEGIGARDVLDRLRRVEAVLLETQVALHTLEAANERLLAGCYGLDDDDVQELLDETGTPAGWYPLIAGYDALPPLRNELAVSAKLLKPLAGEPGHTPSPEALADLKRRLGALYQAGPGAKAEDEKSLGEADENDEEENEATVSGARIPIPAETFLEELSQKLEIHPISVYWLLTELRKQEELVSPPLVKQALEDYVSITILRLLGYRWSEQDTYEKEHRQILDPALVDEDGIITLVSCGDQPTALERVRMRLERDFGPEGAERSEREFRQWVGRDLEDWLRRDFFKRHVQQFKQRPIAWHLVSPERTFEAFVLYHKLSRATLQKLRAQYAGGLIARLRAEQERARQRGAAAEVSRLQLQIEDVEEFRARLEKIERGDELRYRIRCRWKGEADTGRPAPYAPDIDDGVKVNIRPFQEAGLLAVKEVIKKW